MWPIVTESCSRRAFPRWILGATLSIACAAPRGSDIASPHVNVDYAMVARAEEGQGVQFERDVRPILENRCVVCHGCYDAPCQLKLSSFEGIARGGSKEVVYDGARIAAAEPSRLFIDAISTDQWRERGFHSVLQERPGSP